MGFFSPRFFIIAKQFQWIGRVAEWFKAPVLKTGVPARVPWVRIPPLPPEVIDIIEQFRFVGSYAQSNVQSVFDDLGALCFLSFMIGLAIIFIAGKISDCRKWPPG